MIFSTFSVEQVLRESLVWLTAIFLYTETTETAGPTQENK